MKTIIRTMSQQSAVTIADHWKYEEPYSFYDATADEEDYQELIDPEKRNNQYYEVWKNKELYGYFVIILDTPDTAELGLGLRPDLTGKGLGQSFILEILQFLTTTFPAVTEVELSVAAFNKRAIKQSASKKVIHFFNKQMVAPMSLLK